MTLVKCLDQTPADLESNTFSFAPVPSELSFNLYLRQGREEA